MQVSLGHDVCLSGPFLPMMHLSHLSASREPNTTSTQNAATKKLQLFNSLLLGIQDLFTYNLTSQDHKTSVAAGEVRNRI